MRTFIPPRLRKPAMIALAGTLFAAALVVHGGGGPSWWVQAIVAEVAMLSWAVTVYVRSGPGRDEDALVGASPDERQQLVAQRSWALAGKTALAAAFAGLTIAVAVRSAAWWPFVIILAVTGFAYLFGLSTYGVGEESPADDDAGAGHVARSPVSR